MCYVLARMWGIILAGVIALTFTGASGAVVDKENFQIANNVEWRPDFTSILLKVLESKYSTGENDLQLEDKIAVLDNFLGRNTVANTIRQVLESFRPIVINGSGDIPPLCPLAVNQLGPFVITHTGLRLNTNIQNFRMEGLRWYVVNDVTFNALRLTVGVRMTLPWLVSTGRYDSTTWIGLVQHRSGGNFRFFINRVDINSDGRLGTNLIGGHLVLRELRIKIVVQDVQTQINGMTGSAILNGVINNIVQSLTRDFVNNEMENVSRIITETLFDIINDILKDFTLDDLLGRLTV